MIWRLILVTAVLATSLIFTGPTEGTTLIPKDFRELVTEAERIVVGTVTSERAAWVDGPNSVIFTHWTVSVEATWKGEATKSIIVSEVGGQIGDVGCYVPSMPRYSIGDRIVVPLKKDALGQWRTHGCIQGQFKVSKKRSTDEDLVHLSPSLTHVWRAYFDKDDVSPGFTVFIEDFEAKAKTILAEQKKKEEKK